MRLYETKIERTSGTARLVGRIQAEGGRPEELHFAVSEEFAGFLDDSADPFVPALLLPCLEAGEDLHIDPTRLHPRLLRQLRQVQDILVSWHAGFRRIAVEAPAREGPPAPGAARAGAYWPYSRAASTPSTRFSARSRRPARTTRAPPTSCS